MTPLWNNQTASDLEARSQNAEYQVRLVTVHEIHVKSARRPINEKKVKEIAASVRQIGLRDPITVHEWRPGKFRLITGNHRLEAFKLLKEETIPAFVMTSSRTDRLLWEDAENFYRADLTMLQKAEAVARQARRLLESSGQPPGGRQKHDRGISKAARALGLSKRAVGRYLAIAAIDPKAKAEIGPGLDNDGSSLLAIAKLPTEKEQLARVLGSSDRGSGSRPGKPTAPSQNAKASVIDWYGLFGRKFREAPLSMRIAYARLSTVERNRFAREELAHLVRST